ncbi:MAG TPA: hypothetical protein VMV29_16070 [Ktedonobacterales bacterium]|nr:hypothetical protein [Ktedonobacterales bacterium]
MYQMTVTFTDDEYAQLMAEATKHDQPIESLAHDLIARRLPQASVSNGSFIERLYKAGKVLNLPRHTPLAAEEVAARERLAARLAGGALASDMVSEDRGPR